MTDSHLSAKARVIYSILDEHAREKGVCWPSQETLVRRSGFPERTLRRCLAELLRDGRITIERSGMPARNHYSLAGNVADQDRPDRPPMADQDRPPMAGLKPPVLITESEKLESVTPKPPSESEAAITVAEFRELEDAWERHLKHHRSEPRDMVLRMLMHAAQRRVFDWTKFRARHAEWCAAQERGGWQYATLTLLAWFRAGMPAAPGNRRIAPRNSAKADLPATEAERLLAEADAKLADW